MLVGELSQHCLAKAIDQKVNKPILQTPRSNFKRCMHGTFTDLKENRVSHRLARPRWFGFDCDANPVPQVFELGGWDDASGGPPVAIEGL